MKAVAKRLQSGRLPVPLYTPILSGCPETISDDEWRDSLAINFLAAVRMNNAVLHALKQSKAAVIVNISAGGTSVVTPALAHRAAKAALNSYSKTISHEFGPLGIRVATVTPGATLTLGGDEVRKVMTDAMGIPPEAIFGNVPLRRFGEASEVAEVVALLASGRAKYVTGVNYYVDGGFAAPA